MKNNYIILISAVMLSVSLVFSAVYIGNAINNAEGISSDNNKTTQSLLMNSDQAAEYIGISVETLLSQIKREKVEKYKLSVYDTYNFIPYLNVDGVMYFTKSELEKWVEYKTQNH
jgi:ABC-type antimicrobial peptide transport system permease subunit